MEHEADLDIRRREAVKELPLCIRVEQFPSFVLDDHGTVDEHVQSLVRQRFISYTVTETSRSTLCPLASSSRSSARV